jgi:hypothetical protein
MIMKKQIPIIDHNDHNIIMDITSNYGRSALPLATNGTQELVSIKTNS